MLLLLRDVGRFSLRSVVFAYPDGVVALWIMLACRFEAPSVV